MSVLLSVAEMQLADRLAIASGVPGFELMQRAGQAVADAARARIAAGAAVAVLCGPGNNGGDGFVAAAVLRDNGFDVRLALLGSVSRLTGDAARAAAVWAGPIMAPTEIRFDHAALIVDALFGAGLTRALTGAAAELILRVNTSAVPVLAVDLPSGLDGDSGQALGAVVKATATVTFVRAKPGHWLEPGRALSGHVTVADIGIPASVLATIRPRLVALSREFAISNLPWPDPAGHKYNRGHAVVVAGGIEGVGAARLAARAALRSGAGVVTLAVPDDALLAHAGRSPDALMVRRVDDPPGLATLLADPRITSIVLGPALGAGSAVRVAATRASVHAALTARRAVVLDADALTSFAGLLPELIQAIANTGCTVVLTPHEGEFRRLFGDAVDQAGSKLARAGEAARRSGAIVLHKGADTVVAAPDGRAAINTSGTPWLATAGSGDVLAGVIGGLLAQGVPGFEAAATAAWLHGEAGSTAGPALIADDLPEAVGAVIAKLCEP